MRTFIARYPGSCAAECGERISPGDDVVYVDDRLVHTDCADGLGPMPTPRAVTVCVHCHLVQPCDCD